VARVYRVSFFKRLSDSTGHQFSARQGTVDVQAGNEDAAIGIARQKFALLEDINLWSLRADYEEVELLPDRKRLPDDTPHRLLPR
jgi:acetyl-CoA carboxylase carboxyltransferase component